MLILLEDIKEQRDLKYLNLFLYSVSSKEFL